MGIVDIFEDGQRGDARRVSGRGIPVRSDLTAHKGGSLVAVQPARRGGLCKADLDWPQECFPGKIHVILARELGVFRLRAQENNPWDEVTQFFLTKHQCLAADCFRSVIDPHYVQVVSKYRHVSKLSGSRPASCCRNQAVNDPEKAFHG